MQEKPVSQTQMWYESCFDTKVKVTCLILKLEFDPQHHWVPGTSKPSP